MQNPLNLIRPSADWAGEVVHAARHALVDFFDPHSDEDVDHPDPLNVARISLAMATASRQAEGDPHAVMALMSPLLDDVHPYHFVEVSLSLASMVAAIASDEQLAAFGQTLMEAEVTR